MLSKRCFAALKFLLFEGCRRLSAGNFFLLEIPGRSDSTCIWDSKLSLNSAVYLFTGTLLLSTSRRFAPLWVR
jgi:hypothetical protein